MLTYPIGLITSDEVMYAGYSVNNWADESGYLNYHHSIYLTMSGGKDMDENDATYSFAYDRLGVIDPIDGYPVIRPVINLNPNVEITGGLGTKTNPYVVKTN